MEKELIEAFKHKDYPYIMEKLKPLFYGNLTGVPTAYHDDFIQEYQILSYQLIEEYSFDDKTSGKIRKGEDICKN